MYVDADYASLYGVEKFEDPISVRSRTGYIIILGGWPLIWKSKLQDTCATSTTHAEYIALSTSLKTMLPLHLGGNVGGIEQVAGVSIKAQGNQGGQYQAAYLFKIWLLKYC